MRAFLPLCFLSLFKRVFKVSSQYATESFSVLAETLTGIGSASILPLFSLDKYEGSFSFNPAKSTPFADNYASKKSPDEDLHNISKSLDNIVKLKL